MFPALTAVPDALPAARRPPGQVVRLQLRPASTPRAPSPATATATAQVLPLFLARAIPAPPHAAVCFTTQDRMALLSWRHAGSGYVRVVIEDGRPGDAPDRGAFVLAYREGEAFASVGLTRTPTGVQTWRCADGEVLAMHAAMGDALAALPPG